MQKISILQEIFDIENVSSNIANCPKITESKLLLVMSKSSYNLKDELGISANTVRRYLDKLFPDRPKNNSKVCNYLLLKYGYKQCKHCKEVLELDDFYTNSSTLDGLSTYCRSCQAYLEKPTATARTAKYRAAKLLRSPSWVSKEELEQISQFYRDCPAGSQVDHIIPLQGELVSGLHVLSNLQYLSIEANASKRNKYLPT